MNTDFSTLRLIPLTKTTIGQLMDEILYDPSKHNPDPKTLKIEYLLDYKIIPVVHVEGKFFKVVNTLEVRELLQEVAGDFYPTPLINIVRSRELLFRIYHKAATEAVKLGYLTLELSNLELFDYINCERASPITCVRLGVLDVQLKSRGLGSAWSSSDAYSSVEMNAFKGAILVSGINISSKGALNILVKNTFIESMHMLVDVSVPLAFRHQYIVNVSRYFEGGFDLCLTNISKNALEVEVPIAFQILYSKKT